ncbi:glycoside hydrolase family 18 protein [Granulicella sibirica]|uniref:chitinase n=1 Tax=Granulicella sibirica TaxID=2479048 RepID=A0A4Q0TAU0_9BACT|nr:glycoside hydrolase family 18 protein [Granulicella sibirica]RXH58896.1 Chitinase [Granulicella sibirica]
MRLHQAILLALLTLPAAAQTTLPNKTEIIAYVFPKDRILAPNEVAATKLTRINYAFANVTDGKVVEGFAHDRENFAILNALKQQNPTLKILVSVGGWTWSKNFSDAALTKESRRIFIDSSVDFVLRYNLDGLDIDWEYPGLKGDDNKFRPEDKENYTALLKELRQRFDREGRRLHRHLYTSIATGASKNFFEHTEMAKVQHYVDSINLMTYDMYGGDKNTGHHSPLYEHPDDPKHVSSNKSVHNYLEAGVKPNKIVLGVPFYGKSWSNVTATNNGLFQSGAPTHNVYLNYGSIASTLLQPTSGYTRYWDATSDSPYLYNPTTQTWVDYEDAESLAHKTLYVRDYHLGGMMFWEYTGDPNNVLLDAINAGLRP